MYDLAAGNYFRMFLSSDDLTTASDVTLLDAQGNTLIVAVGERVVITDIAINNGATASVVTIFVDTDDDGTVDAGESLYAASLAIKGGVSSSFFTPLQLPRKPTATAGDVKVKASAASVGTTVILTGFTTKG